MALVLLAGAGYAYYNKQRELKEELAKRIQEEELDFVNAIPIKLLPLEVSSTLLKSMPLSTITFFEVGDDTNVNEICGKLKAGVTQVIKKNLWLAGFVAQRPGDAEFQLWHDPQLDPEQAAERSFANHCGDDENDGMTLSRDMPYEKWLEVTKQFLVAPNSEVLNRKSKALWKITMLPTVDKENNNKKSGFALIVSMCHTFGDYHTFYQLHEMLLSSLSSSSSDDDDNKKSDSIYKLNPFRQPDFQEKAAELLGKEEVMYMTKTNPALWEKDNTQTSVLAFTISQDWILEKMAETTSSLRTSLGSHKLIDASLISWFFNLAQPTVGLLANSLRDYLDCINQLDAGNYQNPIPLLPEDFATPARVQEALISGKRFLAESDVCALPKYFDAVDGMLTFSWGVNWLPSSKAMMTSTTSSNWEPILHMPLMATQHLKEMPSRLSGILLFRVNSEKLGALCMCKKPIIDKVIQSGIIDETLCVL